MAIVPAVVEMRSILASGALGKPLHLSFRCHGNFGFLKAQHSHWVREDCGGGVFSAVGTHYTDLCRHLTVRAPKLETSAPSSSDLDACPRGVHAVLPIGRASR